jgi:release factor glutamine methyltransferase
MKFVEALAFVTDSLTQAKVPNPQVDAYWLICHAARISRSELLNRMTFDFGLTDPQREELLLALEKRMQRIPLQHITGSAGFRDFELRVGPGVFIPRPETEMVAQLGIDYLRQIPSSALALDIGSGSGAIAISLAREVIGTRVIAVEASQDAAAYTAQNIQGLAPSVELRVGDFQDNVLDLSGSLDLLISNPPYIPIDAIPIDQEVREHDPDLALYGGQDGLDVIREIIQFGPLLLKRGGMLVLEHADGQSDAVCELLLAEGFSKVQAHSDLTERLRSVSAIW